MSASRTMLAPAVAASTRGADGLLKALALVVLTYVWRVQDVIAPLAKIKFPTLVALVALEMYLVDTKGIRRVRYVRSPILYLLFTFAIVVTAGIPTSLLPSASLDFLLKDFLPDVLMALLIGASVRDTRDLDRILGYFLGGALLFNIYVLFAFGLDASGRLAHLVYYDANDLAQTIICTLPITFYFLGEGSARWQRRLALAAIPLLLTNFVRAGSRGGFLGFIAIGLLSLFAYEPVKLRKRLLSLLLIIAAIGTFGGDAFWANMKTIMKPEDDYNMQAETGRWQLWQNGLSIIRQRPFLGVGARQFPQADATLSDFARQRIALNERRLPWQPAHNAYVSVAAETGLGGFVVFVSLLVVGLVTAIRLARGAKRRPEEGSRLAALSRALAISLVGYMVSAFFLTAEYQSILYFMFGTLLGIRKLAMLGPPARVASATAPPARRIAFAPASATALERRMRVPPPRA